MKITTEQIITLVSLIGAILAWIAKIRWSNEYKIAKDEIIKSKDSLITQLKETVQFYKDMTPMKIKEYFDTVKKQLEDYNLLLSEQLESAKKEIAEMEHHAQSNNPVKISIKQLSHIQKDTEIIELGKKIQANMSQFDWVTQTEEWDLAELNQNILRNQEED